MERYRMKSTPVLDFKSMVTFGLAQQEATDLHADGEDPCAFDLLSSLPLCDEVSPFPSPPLQPFSPGAPVFHGCSGWPLDLTE